MNSNIRTLSSIASQQSINFSMKLRERRGSSIQNTIKQINGSEKEQELK